MEVDEIFEFKKNLDKNGLIFCYSGVISQGVLEEIGEVLKYKIGIKISSSNIVQRVFSIFIEQVQNIMKYSAEKSIKDTSSPEELKSGIVIIGHKEEVFFIETGNLIHNNDLIEIKEKLDMIKTMTKADLKKYYREQIHKNDKVLKDSAGLGLIHIARKASGPIEYAFHEHNKNFSFFSLKVMI